VTSGGTSTCSETFLGKLRTYDYKTVRYPGHYAIVRAFIELGFMGREAMELDSGKVAPIALTRRLFEQQLVYPDVHDLVVLRATVSGRRDGRMSTVQFDLFDRHDPATGLTAMERTTAFPTALVAFMQARKEIAPGARPLETCIPTRAYVKELAQHDLRILERES
jgi:lysine 6-dehydrogenase